MRIAAWAVIAATAAGAGSTQGETAAERRALYDALDVAAIVWGKESDGDQVGVMDPPFFTADPDRVEVLTFDRYTDDTWHLAEPFTAAWRASLPAGVVVRRVPRGIGWQWKDPLRKHWKVHQRVYLAAELAGIEAEVGEAMAAVLGGRRNGLGSPDQVARLARTVGVDPETFSRWVEAPLVEARVRQATIADGERILAEEAQGADLKRSSLSPAFLINGRYAVSADAVGDPGEAYRIANRIIREELASGRTQDGPTNNEQFTEWMAPREGEVFRRQRFGKALKFRAVYSHARRELWELNRAGAVARTYRLTGEGDRAYFAVSPPARTVRFEHVWRRARQYVPFEGESGPVRYGALLLTDYLSAPETLWVELPFKGRDAPFAFTADGRVESRNEKGSLFGTWWLEAGELKVSFGELGVQSWPWRDAARQVGFEIPEESVRPWRSSEARKLAAGGADAGAGQ